MAERARWRRFEAGWYSAEIGGTRVDVINMHGQSVRFSGQGQHVQVRVGGEGRYGIGSRTVREFYTITEAKRWAEEEYA